MTRSHIVFVARMSVVAIAAAAAAAAAASLELGGSISYT